MAWRGLLQVLAAGHGQHCARLQAVHVVAREGLGILSVQAHQHLVQRHARQFMLLGNGRQRLAALDVDGFLGRGCSRLRLRGWGCRRRGGFVAGRRAGSSTAGRRCRRSRRGQCGGGLTLAGRRRGRHHRRGGRGGHCRRHGLRHVAARRGRIKQQGVLAHQPPLGPAQVQDDVDKRLLHRAITGDAQIGAPIAATLKRDRRRAQHRVVVHAGSFIGIGGRNLDLQGRALVIVEAADINLCVQRFTQRGLNRQAPQAHSPCGMGHQHTCRQRRRSGHPSGQQPPTQQRMIFQGLSQLVMGPLHQPVTPFGSSQRSRTRKTHQRGPRKTQ